VHDGRITGVDVVDQNDRRLSPGERCGQPAGGCTVVDQLGGSSVSDGIGPVGSSVSTSTLARPISSCSAW